MKIYSSKNSLFLVQQDMNSLVTNQYSALSTTLTGPEVQQWKLYLFGPGGVLETAVDIALYPYLFTTERVEKLLLINDKYYKQQNYPEFNYPFWGL